MAGGPLTISLTVDTAPLMAALKRLGPLAGQELAHAMLPELRQIYAGSQSEVPVRRGALKESGRIVVPRVYPDAVVGRVIYGRRGIAYAVAVHQIPGRRGYKFLEGPAKKTAAGLESRLAARLRGIERGAAR